MKYLIFGLGNIGSEYKKTRHNIGFSVLDTYANDENVSFKTDCYADIAEVKYKGRTLKLVKPSTYMNLSGNAVQYWMQKEKVPTERVLIITDDLALPFGKIRIRAKGSDGGHNGLKDIQRVIGNANYPRLRFGVGNNFGKGQQVNYVLGEWNAEELETLNERIERCINATKAFTTLGLARTMSEFNNNK